MVVATALLGMVTMILTTLDNAAARWRYCAVRARFSDYDWRKRAR